MSYAPFPFAKFLVNYKDGIEIYDCGWAHLMIKKIGKRYKISYIYKNDLSAGIKGEIILYKKCSYDTMLKMFETFFHRKRLKRFIED